MSGSFRHGRGFLRTVREFSFSVAFGFLEGNETVMADDLLNAYEFEVQLGIMVKINFSKITNLSMAAEYNVYGDGGENSRMYFGGKPHRTPDTIAFHKGWSTGLEAMVTSWLVPGLKINGIIILVKRNGTLKKSFYIEQGIITRVSFSDLDAMSSNIIIKTMELAHTGLKEYGI